jgi:hypothetical protein
MLMGRSFLFLFLLLSGLPALSEENNPLSDLYGRTYHISIKGDYLFASSTVGLTVYKLEGDKLKQVSALSVENGGSYSIRDGDYLYLFAGSAGVYKVDIKDPFRPQVVLNIRIPGSALNGDIYQNYIVIALGSMGFAVLDIKKLNVVKKVETPSYCAFVKVIDNRLLVSTEKDGIIIYDLSNPANIKKKQEIQVSRRVRDIYVRDNLLFLANDTAGISVYKIEWNKFSFVGTYKTEDTARGLTGYKDYIFVADGNTGIVVFKLDTNNALSPIKKFKTDYSTNKVIIKDQKLIVSHDAMGVLVMDINNLIN